MILLKCCTQYASKFGKLSSGHRTGKGQFSFQFPKKGKAKEFSNSRIIAVISHASKVMLKILQARLQQYVNYELLDVQSKFSKRQRNQRSNCQLLLDHQKSKRVPEKHLFLLIDYAKVFDCVDHNRLWKILQEMGIPDHLTYLMRNLYAAFSHIYRSNS